MRPGHFYAINRTADLAETVGRFYEVWSNRSGRDASRSRNSTTTAPIASKLHLSIPYEDLEGKGLVMSISQAFYDGVGGLCLGISHGTSLFDFFKILLFALGHAIGCDGSGSPRGRPLGSNRPLRW